MTSDAAHEESAGGHDAGGMMRWLLTYADMITLLMAFFIMMYSMSVVSLDKFDRAATGLRAEFGPPTARPGAAGGRPSGRPSSAWSSSIPLEEDIQSVEDRLQEYIGENQLEDLVRLTHERRGLVISLVSEAELRASALAILDRIAGLLLHLPNLVVIEGHTCDLPISTPRYPSNWELSAARACRVARYLVEQKAIPSTRLAATGYADSRPVASNETEDGRVRNRRVHIVVLSQTAPASSSQERAEAGP
jgi:chemotaxis protein MotB